MAVQLHAADEDELGLQIVHPGTRNWIHRLGLDVRNVCTAQNCEVLGHRQDCDYEEGEAEEDIQSRPGEHAHIAMRPKTAGYLISSDHSPSAIRCNLTYTTVKECGLPISHRATMRGAFRLCTKP